MKRGIVTAAEAAGDFCPCGGGGCNRHCRYTDGGGDTNECGGCLSGRVADTDDSGVALLMRKIDITAARVLPQKMAVAVFSVEENKSSIIGMTSFLILWR